MRHKARLEVSETIPVNDKLNYLHDVKGSELLTYVDVASAAGDTLVTMLFNTEDGDRGRIQIHDRIIDIYVDKSFERLVNLHTFTTMHFGDILIDLIGADEEPPEVPEVPIA